MPHLTIASPEGDFSGYLALPKPTAQHASMAGIIVAQEIFGVNANIRATADFYASRGYIALAPDLFWRTHKGCDLNPNNQADMEKAFALYKTYDPAQGAADIQAAIQAVRAHEGASGKVGVVGYCLGGLLAYLSATRTDADACVGYYGVSIPDYLGEADKISKPLALHIAQQDGFVPPQAQDAIAQGLGSKAQVTLYSYEDCDHAFARPGGEGYNATQAKLADTRTQELFAKALR